MAAGYRQTEEGHALRSIPAELLTIGTELLLGEIADTNAQFIARTLRDNGLDLRRVTTVGDDRAAIAEAVRQIAGRARVVLITGGLGPTVDDPTRAAVADAAGVPLEFHPELWKTIQARFQKAGRPVSENNRLQAQMPQGATAIPNPLGTAPGFSLDINSAIVIAMPGVPAEMKRMLCEEALPLLRNRWEARDVLRMRTLHVGGIGESQIDARVGEWERSVNPLVGLAARSGVVDVRISARAANVSEADALIAAAEKDIRVRLDGFIFGADGDSLAAAVLRNLPSGTRLASWESGTRGVLAGQLEAVDHPAFMGGWVHPAGGHFKEDIETWRSEHDKEEYLAAIRISRFPDRSEAELCFDSPRGRSMERRRYDVAQTTVAEWAVHQLLFLIWQKLQ